MTLVKAAAMWADASIRFNAARIIVKHLCEKFGQPIQVPFSQILLLGDVTTKSEPTFEEFVDKCNDKNKIAKTMKYWYYHLPDLLELDFARLLMSNYSKHSQTTYGYPSPEFGNDEEGIFVIFGSDHGGGSNKYLLCSNYLPSQSRQINDNKVDHGTQTVHFSQVECKKDIYDIHV